MQAFQHESSQSQPLPAGIERIIDPRALLLRRRQAAGTPRVLPPVYEEETGTPVHDVPCAVGFGEPWPRRLEAGHWRRVSSRAQLGTRGALRWSRR